MYKSPLFAQAGGSILAYKDESGKFIKIDPNNIPDTVDLSLPTYQLPAHALTPSTRTVNYGAGDITRDEGKFTSQYGTLEAGKIYISSGKQFTGLADDYRSLPLIFKDGKLRILEGFDDLDLRISHNPGNSTQYTQVLNKIKDWMKNNPDADITEVHPDLFSSYNLDQVMQNGSGYSVYDNKPYDAKNPTASADTTTYQKVDDSGEKFISSVKAAGGNLITDLAKKNSEAQAIATKQAQAQQQQTSDMEQIPTVNDNGTGTSASAGYTPGYKGIYEQQKESNLNKEAINHLFKNYHNRDANAEELAYWTGKRVGNLEDTLAKTTIFSGEEADKIRAEMMANGQTYIRNQAELEQLAKSGGLNPASISNKASMLFTSTAQTAPNSPSASTNNGSMSTGGDFMDSSVGSGNIDGSNGVGGFGMVDGGATGGGSGGNNNFNTLLMDLINQDPFLAEQFKDPAKLALFQGMPAALQDTYLQVLKQLQVTIEAGNVINPDIDLSPEKVAEFLQQATSELDPYYQEQIGFYKQDLDISLQRMQEDFNKNISRGEDTFKEGLLNQAENEAQSGTAFSSGRQDRVSKTIKAGQQGIDDLVTQAARSAQDFGIGAERALGSANIPNIGGFNTYNVTDQGFSQSGNRNLFTPQGNLLGSIPKQRTVDISNRQGQLINAEKNQRILDFSTL